MKRNPLKAYDRCYDVFDFVEITAALLKEDPMGAKYIIYSILTTLGFIGLILLVIALTVLLGAKGLLLGSIILISLGSFAVWELVKCMR